MENEVILFNCVGRITGKWLEMYYACGISCFSKNTILIHVLYNINTILVPAYTDLKELAGFLS